VLAGVICAVFLGGPGMAATLRWERAAVAAGEYWRLATGHFVHADATHLAWNLLGAALVWWLFGREFRLSGWALILAGSMLAIDAALQWFVPSLDWYVGLSGVLHGCMAAGLYAWLHERRDWSTLTLAVLFAAKLIWEAIAGPLSITATTLALPVVVEAHLAGAIGGLLMAMALTWRRGRRGTSR
jgi:rhomboid family GlyGly-CTERM serine protease